MVHIPNFKKLRTQLISDPVLLKELCIKLEIIVSDDVSKNPERLIDSCVTNGFSVTAWVDDDNLSEDEKKIKYGDLADKCIKKLKEKGMKGDFKR